MSYFPIKTRDIETGYRYKCTQISIYIYTVYIYIYTWIMIVNVCFREIVVLKRTVLHWVVCLWIYFYHVRQQRFAGSSFSVVLGKGFQDQAPELYHKWWNSGIRDVSSEPVAHAMKNNCFLFNFKINFIHVWTCFLRWSWLIKSSNNFVPTARPSARQSFCQEPSNQGIVIYIYIYHCWSWGRHPVLVFM